MEPNLARVDLVSLRLVLLCAELGTISHAAVACNVSISCASGRLIRLEQTYRTKLFLRHRRGMQLTAFGRIVAQHAAHIFNAMHEMNMQLAGILNLGPNAELTGGLASVQSAGPDVQGPV